MNFYTIAKTVIAGASTAGTGLIIGNAIKATTPASTNLYQKALLGVGTIVLSGVASAKVAEAAEKQMDDISEAVKLMKN